jgi:2-dehydro-3-deoxyphosphogluconate aldolase/(4S)-4-hydroxy-2-oxoglutarate aldolase
MTRAEVSAKIKETGIVPSIRVGSADEALFGARAVFSGGIYVVELTMTIPDGPEAIRELVKGDARAVVGAGTVLDLAMAKRCLDAGAAFLTSPGLDRDVAGFAMENGIAYIPGALTPGPISSKCFRAHRWGDLPI